MKQMEYTVISGTEMNVSRIAQGTWAIGGWMWGGTDERESIRTIHGALDKGINLIDTAPVYDFGVSEETARTMQALFKEGLIRAIGVSNYSPEQMNQFMSVSELHTVQAPYNLFERQIDRDVLPYVREKNLSAFAYGPLCRGLLTGTMQPDTKFTGDDLRQSDPKFQPP